MTDQEKIELLMAALAWYADPGPCLRLWDRLVLLRHSGRAREALRATGGRT